MKSKLLRSSLIISFGIVLGRASGLIREYVIAHKLGASIEADIAIVLLTLPDFFISLLIGKTISAIIVPQIHQSKPSSHKPLFFKTSFVFFCIFSLIAILLASFSPSIWKIFAPGLNLEHPESTYSLLKICSISIPIIALCSISRAFLQSAQKFTFIGLENLLYNLTFVFAFIVFYPKMDLLAVSIGVVLAALIKYIPQLLISMRKTKGKVSLSDLKITPDTQIIKRYIQVLISYNILTMLPYLARAACSFREEGALAIFNYAFKVSELPKTLLISTITMVIFPYLSSALQRAKTDGRKVIQKSLLLSMTFSFIIILVTIPLLFYFYQNPFSVGQLTSDTISILCVSVGIAILGMPAEAFNYNIIMLMHANRDTHTPTYINIVGAVIAVPIIWILGKNMVYGSFIGLVFAQWLLFPAYLWQLALYNKNVLKNE